MSSIEDDPQSQNYQSNHFAAQYGGDPGSFFNPYQAPVEEGEIAQPNAQGLPYQSTQGIQQHGFYNPMDFKQDSSNLNNRQNSGGPEWHPQPPMNGMDGYNGGEWVHGPDGYGGGHFFGGTQDSNNIGMYNPQEHSQDMNENWNPQPSQDSNQNQWGYPQVLQSYQQEGYATGFAEQHAPSQQPFYPEQQPHLGENLYTDQHQEQQDGLTEEERRLIDGVVQSHGHERQESVQSGSVSNDADHESVSSAGGLSGFFHSDDGVDLVNPSPRENPNDGRNSVGLSGPDIIPSTSQENLETSGSLHYGGSAGGFDPYGAVKAFELPQGAIPDIGQNPVSIHGMNNDLRPLEQFDGSLDASGGGLPNAHQNSISGFESQRPSSAEQSSQQFPSDLEGRGGTTCHQVGSGEPVPGDVGVNEQLEVSPLHGGVGDSNTVAVHPSLEIPQNNLVKPELLPTDEQGNRSRPNAVSSDLLSDIHEAQHVSPYSESPALHGRTESNPSSGTFQSEELSARLEPQNTHEDNPSSRADEASNIPVGYGASGSSSISGSIVHHETNQPDLPSEALSSISRQNSKPDIMEVNDVNILSSPKGPSKLVPALSQVDTPHSSAFRSITGRHTPKQTKEVSPSPPLWSADMPPLSSNILLAPASTQPLFSSIAPIPQVPVSTVVPPRVSTSQDVTSLAANVAKMEVPGIPAEAQRLLQQTSLASKGNDESSAISQQLGQMRIDSQETKVSQAPPSSGVQQPQPSFDFGKAFIINPPLPPSSKLPTSVPSSQNNQVQSTSQVPVTQPPGITSSVGQVPAKEAVPVSSESIPQSAVPHGPPQPGQHPGTGDQQQYQQGMPQGPFQQQGMPPQYHQSSYQQQHLGNSQPQSGTMPPGMHSSHPRMPYQQTSSPAYHRDGHMGPQPMRAQGWYAHQGSPYNAQFPPYGGQWGTGYGQMPTTGYGSHYDEYGRPPPPGRPAYGRQSPSNAADRRSPHTVDRRSPHSSSDGDRPGSRQGYDRPSSRQGRWGQEGYYRNYPDQRRYRDEYSRRAGYDWATYNRQSWYDRGRFKDHEYYYKYYNWYYQQQQQRGQQNHQKDLSNQSLDSSYKRSSQDERFANEFHHQGGGTPDQYGSDQSRIHAYSQGDSFGYNGSADGSLLQSYPYEEAPRTVTPPPPERMTPVKFAIPHVVARFSPGGHLIKVLPNTPQDGMPARVEVHSIEQMIEDQDLLSELRGFPGPLIRGETHKADVIGFSTLRARDALSSTDATDSASVSLLWELMVLLCRQNGSILETDVSELLLHNHPVLHQLSNEEPQSNPERKTSVATNITDMHKETQEFRRYLLYGRKRDALESAMKAGLWGHALLLACKIDARTHSSVMTRFANSLEMNDPLQTLYQLMSDRQPAAVTSCSDEKWGDWRPHLAMILSNLRSSDSDLGIKSITTLGDSLAVRGLLHASQFCYLMAQVGLGSYSHKNTKIVLLGSSHSLPFKEFATNLSIQLTEVYEYAQLLGNKQYLLPNFQAYKFLYATRLAECGMLVQALHYCEVIANTIQVSPHHYNQTLVEQICALADQLKYHDSQYFDGGNLTEPQWLVVLRGILQQMKDGSITPPSKSDTPMPWVNSYSNLSTLENESADSQNQDSIPMFNLQSHQLQDPLQQQYPTPPTLPPQQEERPQDQSNLNQFDGYGQTQLHDQFGQTQSYDQYGQVQAHNLYNSQMQSHEQYNQAQTNEQYSQNTTSQEGQQVPQESWGGYGQIQHDHNYLNSGQEAYNENSKLQGWSQNADLMASANSNATEYSTTTGTETDGTTTDFMDSNASQFDYYGATTNRSRSGTVDSMGRTPSERTLTNHRTRTVSGSSTISQKSQKSQGKYQKEEEEEENNKAQPAKPASGGKSWFSGWFSSGPKKPKPKKAHLPDDSNLSIEWDPVKKKWIDKNAGEDEDSGPPPPPPSDHELNKMPTPGSSAPPGGSMPPPAGVNKFSSKLSRRQYVDVLNKGDNAAPAVAPSDLLQPLAGPPSTAPVNFYIPGSAPNSSTNNTQPTETAKIANPDSEPPTPVQNQHQPQFFNPQTFGQSSASHFNVAQDNTSVGINLLQSYDGGYYGPLSHSSSMSSLSEEVSQHFNQSNQEQVPNLPPSSIPSIPQGFAPSMPQTSEPSMPQQPLQSMPQTSAPSIPQSSAAGMPMMFNPSQFTQPASQPSGSRYGIRRKYPAQR